MEFPERFKTLPEYAFPRLRSLLDGHVAGGEPTAMSIGEPQHPFPAWVGDELAGAVSEFNRYPPNNGTEGLLTAISDWIALRFGVPVDPDRQVLSLNGTREGLFNAAIAISAEEKGKKKPVILIPNPFYQVYAVAAVASGAEPVFVNADAETGYLPDYSSLSPDVLNRTTIAYICSPSNPQGAVATPDYWRDLLALAEKHDFRIFSDECYSEIYRGDTPTGALQIAAESGTDPERVAIFHSLSKRSNLPGMRSGFVASGPKSIAEMKKLRAYAGAPLPFPLQRVAERVWRDEAHVKENRALYCEKYELADRVFSGVEDVTVPDAGFFLWLPVDDGEEATVQVWTTAGIRVLPGSYLSRTTPRGDPGKHYIRVAMVAPKSEVERGLTLLRDCLYN
jgi:aspartate/methionine/tyrosine aminotransferase